MQCNGMECRPSQLAVPCEYPSECLQSGVGELMRSLGPRMAWHWHWHWHWHGTGTGTGTAWHCRPMPSRSHAQAAMRRPSASAAVLWQHGLCVCTRTCHSRFTRMGETRVGGGGGGGTGCACARARFTRVSRAWVKRAWVVCCGSTGCACARARFTRVSRAWVKRAWVVVAVVAPVVVIGGGRRRGAGDLEYGPRLKQVDGETHAHHVARSAHVPLPRYSRYSRWLVAR
jgi:hypothetical protein